MTCHAKHLGLFLEGHSMTLQQNRVGPITILLQLFHRNDHHIETMWHYKRYTFLCPKPIRGASAGSTCSCCLNHAPQAFYNRTVRLLVRPTVFQHSQDTGRQVSYKFLYIPIFWSNSYKFLYFHENSYISVKFL
jgi:hypothetical protein